MRNILAVRSRRKFLRESWDALDSVKFLSPVASEIRNLANETNFGGEVVMHSDEEDPYIEILGDDIEAENLAVEASVNVYGTDSVLDLYYVDDTEGVMAFVSFNGLLGIAEVN